MYIIEVDMPIKTVKVKQCKCSRCDYEWIPNSSPNEVKRCPECNSPSWNKTRKMACEKCGHEWFPSSRISKRCPGCGASQKYLKIL